MTTQSHTNRSRTFRSTLASLADVIGGASACAAAAESGRMPSARALKAVGIEPGSWSGIGRR